jgi:hypothetical protein
MAVKLSANTASVTLSELGHNCWKAERFVGEHRCERVFDCNYPEKAKCPAVAAEVKYLEEQKQKSTNAIDAKIAQLRSKTG